MRLYVQLISLYLLFNYCSFVTADTNYHYDKGVVNKLSHCPGHYCGRQQLANGSWSACGACDRGTRRNASSACEPCSDNPSFYDWLYLGFMMLTPLVLHLLCVDFAVKKNSLEKHSWVLYAAVVGEVVLTSIITLLLTPPLGSLSLVSCRPRQLPDWYPLMHNPNPNYEGYLHCTQEAVYPMYSIVFVAYSILLVLVLMTRPEIARRVTKGKKTTDVGAVYSALYMLPALTVIHALAAGVLYAIFPYLVIVGSIFSGATYLAYKQDQSMLPLLKSCVSDVRSVLILLSHWCLHAYGIIALTELQNPVLSWSLCSLVPLPALFYIVTAAFSDPTRIPPANGRRPIAMFERSLTDDHGLHICI